MSGYRRAMVLVGLLVLCLVQVTVFNRSAGSWLSFNAVIIALALLTIMSDRFSLIFLVITSGVIFDLHSNLPFGIYLVSGIVTVLAASWLFEYFLTNRSLYSFVVLTIIATLIYHLVFAGLTFGAYEFGWSGYRLGWNYMTYIVGQIGLHVVIALGVFWVVNRFTVIFKPTYLHS
ncbi:MAG: hypothetical protein KBB55_00830 [Candidatus Buchananbacteria bacterium]|nr:hypothetical protein [Candidatus Buchananbacteria bacterium]